MAASHKIHSVYLKKFTGGKLQTQLKDQRGQRLPAGPPSRVPAGDNARSSSHRRRARTTPAGDLCPTSDLRVTLQKDIKALQSQGVARSDILMVPSEIGTHKKAAAFLEKLLLVNDIRNSSTSFPLICISRRLFSTFYQNITESR